MAIDKEMLEAMAQLLDQRLEPIQKDIAQIKEDVSELKEESAITRHSVNLLLNWAEKSDRLQNIGLYEDAREA